ncbi:MAG: MmcQ/YjbR family DNA-binding protein [Ruminococcus sp.]|nr:MmcQ/YjbR family DNA-binding protein [Ruminococcus sp.]
MEDKDISPQLERIIQHIKSTYGAEPEYLWKNTPNNAVFRHGINKKWYAAVIKLPKSKLGLSGDECVYILDVKCDSLMIGSLLLEKGFFPAYHMNKNSWITILLDESVSDDEIFSLIGSSYSSVMPKLKNKSNK